MPATYLRSCGGTAGAGSGSLRLLRSLFAFLWCFLCFLLRRLPSSAVSASCTSSPTAAMHSSLRREEVEQKFEHHQLPLPPVFLLLLQQSTAAGDDARSSNRSKHGLFVRLMVEAIWRELALPVQEGHSYPMMGQASVFRRIPALVSRLEVGRAHGGNLLLVRHCEHSL